MVETGLGVEFGLVEGCEPAKEWMNAVRYLYVDRWVSCWKTL